MSQTLPDPKGSPLTPQTVFCPNLDCVNRGQVGVGNIGVHSQRDRRYRCHTCGTTFAATTGTVFYRAHVPAEVITLALTLLSHGCPLQAIVAAFGFDERTVAAWARKAGQQSQRLHAHLVERGQVPGRVVQADELWVKCVGDKLWQAMALVVESRLWLGGALSATRDRALLTTLVTRIRACLTRTDLTLCVDGVASYVTAVLRVFRRKVPSRTGHGRSRLQVLPGLRIGQVIKQYAGRRVRAVEERGARGSVETIRRRLTQCGLGPTIQTAYIERLNATFRAAWAGLVRRGRALARTEAWATTGMWLVGCAYNWCWPHRSLRVRAPDGPWQARTPAMAAGLTDHVWTLGEWLATPVPPPPWPAPKRGPGRPRTRPRPDPSVPKRPPGRPRTRPRPDPTVPKRPPGRPRKVPILTDMLDHG